MAFGFCVSMLKQENHVFSVRDRTFSGLMKWHVALMAAITQISSLAQQPHLKHVKKLVMSLNYTKQEKKVKKVNRVSNGLKSDKRLKKKDTKTKF